MKIENIQPFQVWHNGEQSEANMVGIDINFDDMVGSALFRYYILSGTMENYFTLSSGSIPISGDDYANWGHTGDANQEAVDYVCQKLNITIDGGIS